jgi:hypothetical protein
MGNGEKPTTEAQRMKQKEFIRFERARTFEEGWTRMARGQEEPNRRISNKEYPTPKLKTNIQHSTFNFQRQTRACTVGR